MNKTELTDAIAKHAELTKKAAGAALEATLEAIATALASGELVSLVGFGAFSVAARAERPGRNPRTGKEMMIAASKTVKFKAGKELKEKVQ